MIKSVSRLIIQEPNCGAYTGICGVCGEHSEQAWPRNEILQKTTSNITVTFPHNTDAMCEYCVVMWDGGRSNKWNRGLLAVPGMTYFPLIAENAELQTEERPTWAQALRDLNPDTPRVCVLNTDFKKRVWPRAKISQGDHLSMLIHDTSRSISDNRSLSLKRLLEVLAFAWPLPRGLDDHLLGLAEFEDLGEGVFGVRHWARCPQIADAVHQPSAGLWRSRIASS